MRHADLWAQSDGEFLGNEFEEFGFLAGSALELSGNLYHWSNDVLISQLRKFAFASRIVERRDFGHDVVAVGVPEGRVLQGCKRSASTVDCSTNSDFIILSPSRIDRRPFFLGKFVRLRSNTIVLPGSYKMLSVITSCQIPICT